MELGTLVWQDFLISGFCLFHAQVWLHFHVYPPGFPLQASGKRCPTGSNFSTQLLRAFLGFRPVTASFKLFSLPQPRITWKESLNELYGSGWLVAMTVRGCLYVNWCGKTQPTMGSTIPQAWCPRLCKRWNLAEHKQTRQLMWIHFSLFLTVSVMWLAVWGSCLEFHPTMSYNSWAKKNASSPNLLFVTVF